ncbi:Uncharacterised protein [[Clostridium] sordellii]|nr:hypothetical protein [Paeniclostridium sordellii]EPZ58345.1 hypothetical protein H476_1832 [[Clostridium] sordellii VPI 9048] [Paeniclostridium sordellii VPI 9048]CEK37096.1 hypothetical protein JGS6382_04281 [[Clostridium] sordellii] [Paeniclostridium sordellii]CEQ31056.1 Uncharacterised protein [[Clostridium] sordellii] [Paeniclostridium sordellii]
MGRLKLVFQSKAHKASIIDFKREFIESKDSMNSSDGLQTIRSFEQLHNTLIKIEQFKDI